jgi:hypothetical protein
VTRGGRGSAGSALRAKPLPAAGASQPSCHEGVLSLAMGGWLCFHGPLLLFNGVPNFGGGVWREKNDTGKGSA